MAANSSLHDACDRDDLNEVQRIISADPTAVECRGKYDRLPLLIAAKRGNVAICKALLGVVPLEQVKNHLSLSTSHGFSCLYCAVLSGEEEVVDLFVSAVDLEAADLGGLTPLQIAAEKGYADIVRRLLLAGCSSTARDSIGRSPLDWAQAKGRLQCITLLSPEVDMHV